MKKSSGNTSGSGKSTKGTGRGGNNGGRPIRGLAGKSYLERKERRQDKQHGGDRRTEKKQHQPRDGAPRDNRSNQETRRPRPRHEDGRDGSAERAYGGAASRLKISLFGVHAVREALLNPERDISAIYITEQLEDDIYVMIEQANAKGLNRPEPQVLARESLDRALPKGTVHQGIACDAAPLEEVFLPDLIRKADTQKRSVLVLLDQVTDPHNLGAIMRSACAFGADGVIVQSRHAPELNGIVAKTASGAVEHLPVVYETNLARTIETLKEAGYFALALDERGEKTLPEAPHYERTLLILGAEGPGLRPLIKGHCDMLLKLPTAGGFTSLNVSNAAAVSLYAVVTAKEV